MAKRAHIASAAVVLGIAGSLVGVWSIRADDPPTPVVKATAKKTLAETTAILQQPSGFENELGGTTLDELFKYLGQKHGVIFRLDPAVFNKQAGYSAPYETKLSAVPVGGLTVQQLLEVISQDLIISQEPDVNNLGISARPGQIIIGRKYVPPTIGMGEEPVYFVSSEKIMNYLYGPTVHITVENKSLREVVSLLREQSGANIVIDPQIHDAADIKLSVTLNDVKLLTALKITGEMCDVAPALLDNVYYITTKEKAAAWMSETEKNLFGAPAKKKK